MSPLISIIVPIYNVEKYLDECLQSILKQTFSNLEVICVNDGSTDNSLNIIKKYAKLDDRIIIIDKQNSGYGDSLNRGLDEAHGEYIGIVESDDYIDSKMYETLLFNIEHHDVDFVKSNYYLTYGDVKRKDIKVQLLPEEYTGIELSPNEHAEIFNLKTTNWSGLYKTSFLREHNIRHNITPGASYQDTGFYFTICAMANKCLFLSEAFYHYRQDNPNSSINNRDKVYMIVREYEFIKDKLVNLNKFDEFKDIYFYKKFDAYFNFNYNRIAAKHKVEFLINISQELKNDLDQGYCNPQLFSSEEYQVLKSIVANPKSFYIDNLLWRVYTHSKTHS